MEASGIPAPAGPQSPSGIAAPPPAEPQRPAWKRFGGAAALIGLGLLNFGAKLKFLLVLLPKLKILTTSGSMLVSIGAYALIWGFPFAIGFVLLLFVHEMGHVLQLRREGIKATAPMFIPFVGAVVGMKELPKDAAAEARVGLAGPILGSIGCLIALGIYAVTDETMFKALAFTGVLLNLFNLLPVLPLDGGRAMAALSPKVWIVGFVALIGITIAFPNPIILLVLLAGGYETYRRWKIRKDPERQAYHQVSGRNRLLVGLVYVGLAIVLAVGAAELHVERDFGDV